MLPHQKETTLYLDMLLDKSVWVLALLLKYTDKWRKLIEFVLYTLNAWNISFVVEDQRKNNTNNHPSNNGNISGRSICQVK